MRNNLESLYRESLTLLEYYENAYPGFKSFVIQLCFLTVIFDIISKATYVIFPIPLIGIQPLTYALANDIDSALIFTYWGWITVALFKHYRRARRW